MGLFFKKANGREGVAEKKKAEDAHVFFMWLLFENEPQMPQNILLVQALRRKFGAVEKVAGEGGLRSFAVKKYLCHFKDADLPPQILLGDAQPFFQDSVSEFERTQLWNVEEGEELLKRCRYQVFISDMMSFMDYRDRCELLMDWLETAVEVFCDCTAVWVPTAGKLFTAEQIRNHSIPRKDRFVYFAVNARFFHIMETEDMVVDTLGMYAMGLPDVQYHFHGLEPNAVVNHAYNTASYIYENDAPIENGETVDGLLGGQMSREVQWRCAYEEALVQPERVVMDICPGEFAAGNRRG